jgi:hypothetical protein
MALLMSIPQLVTLLGQSYTSSFYRMRMRNEDAKTAAGKAYEGYLAQNMADCILQVSLLLVDKVVRAGLRAHS